jgi:hypothetical protein
MSQEKEISLALKNIIVLGKNWLIEFQIKFYKNPIEIILIIVM